MKLAIIYRPRNAPPMEAMAGMFEGVSQWVQKYEGRIDPLYFFVSGGGFGVADVDDEAELQKMLAEHPFTTYADVEVRPVVDAKTAIRNLQEAFAQRGG